MFNFKKILLIFVCLSLTVLLCFIKVNKQVAVAKIDYAAQVTEQLDQYLRQQTYILQRLGKNLIMPIKQNNPRNISQYLSAYEDILFILAKQNLVIPSSMHLVSLDAPQQIIGSYGLLDGTVLAPDENYYIQAVEQPMVLQVSKLYTKQDMPDYIMVNLGVGIVDDAQNYLGHLDLKLATATLRDHLAYKLKSNSELFSFIFTDNSLLHPEIILVKSAYWLKCLTYIFWRLSLFGSAGALGFMLYNLYNNMRAKNLELARLQSAIQLLTQEISHAKTAAEVQHAYGVLLNAASDHMQIIEIQQLLKDVQAVNANLANDMNVTLIFPTYNAKPLRFYGQTLRLMQILSGILYEMILQNSIGGIIELQVTMSDSSDGQQRLRFIFSDNGYYDKLQDSMVELSAADVRCKGWSNILQLIDIEDGALEHVHTAYVGNTVILTVLKRIVNNVINLEDFYQATT